MINEDDITFQNVWMEKDQDLLDEIVAVWVENKAIRSRENAMDTKSSNTFEKIELEQ